MSRVENGAAGRGSPHPMDYCDDVRAEEARGAERPAREPAPGDANPLSRPRTRPFDRRERSP